jgi:DnaJ-domain-containing protein 1
MAITRPSQTCAKAIEIYRMCGLQCAQCSPRSRSPAKQDLRNKTDTVRFSQEALDRLELLKQRQTKDVLKEIHTIREEDSKLEKSLKMLEMDREASVEEIRKAYLHAMQHYHPDKHAYLPPEFRQLAEITSKRINELYSTLLKHKTGAPRRG